MKYKSNIENQNKTMKTKLPKIVDIQGFKVCVEDLIKNEMIPDFFQTPLMCTWELTHKCNLNCVHCYNNSSSSHTNSLELSNEEKLNVARQIVNLKILRFCISGGEPLLCNSLWEIANILKEGKISCNIISNGYLIDEVTAKKISNLFSNVQISIDGAKANTHDKIRGKKGSWKKATDACKLLIENDTTVWICFIPMKDNIREIEKIIDLAYQLGANTFRTEKPKLTGRAAMNYEKIPNKKDFLRYEDIISKKKLEYKDSMKIDYTSDVQKNDSLISKLLPPMYCWITPSGIVTPNNTLPFNAGSLKRKSFKKLWEEIRECHKNKHYLKWLNLINENDDYLKLKDIPYLHGEMYDG